VTEGRILYQNGEYWVAAATFGKSAGYEVNQNRGTHAVRVARIGYTGARGLKWAIAEADRRAQWDQTKGRVDPC
jgi:glycine cleavage system aminomethyltransferase T